MSHSLAPHNEADIPSNVDRKDASVWRPFIGGLRSFIAGRVPEADAEDVLQNTLIRLHESVSSLRDEGRVEAWVFTIARRTIADYYRREEQRPVDGPAGTAEDVVDGEGMFGENLAEYKGEHDVHEEVLSWLRPMAEELPDMYRRPLVMADFEGHTQREVADKLGLSLSGAKSRVQRARDKLGTILRRCCDVEFAPDGRAVAFYRQEV